MAGGGASPPPPSAHQLEPPDEGVLLLVDQPPATRYRLDMIYRAYKWRWQVELLFKEWKSYANLHAFDTAKVAIVEGLIWTAIAAAALKRFLAHMTQLLVEVPMSTRKVAMCAVHVLGDIVRALKTGDVAGLYEALIGQYLSGLCKLNHDIIFIGGFKTQL